MWKKTQFEHLRKALENELRLKRVRNPNTMESLAALFLLSVSVVSRFVSKKKARSLDELIEVVYLLVQVSLSLKENVFDRPEVREFLSHRSKQILSVAREYVELILSKTSGGKSSRSKRFE